MRVWLFSEAPARAKAAKSRKQYSCWYPVIAGELETMTCSQAAKIWDNVCNVFLKRIALHAF
jgi:hypothetical protein